jgi:hypothetical protein
MAPLCCCGVHQYSEESAGGSVCGAAACAPHIPPRIRAWPQGLAARRAYPREHLARNSQAARPFCLQRIFADIALGTIAQSPSNFPSMKSFHLKYRGAPAEITLLRPPGKLQTTEIESNSRRLS